MRALMRRQVAPMLCMSLLSVKNFKMSFIRSSGRSRILVSTPVIDIKQPFNLKTTNVVGRDEVAARGFESIRSSVLLELPLIMYMYDKNHMKKSCELFLEYSS